MVEHFLKQIKVNGPKMQKDNRQYERVTKMAVIKSDRKKNIQAQNLKEVVILFFTKELLASQRWETIKKAHNK